METAYRESQDVRISIWESGVIVVTVDNESQIKGDGQTFYIQVEKDERRLIERASSQPSKP